MARNKINDLRDHLFETLEMLKDGDKKMDLERARVIADVAKVIVNSAKVEVDYVKATGKIQSHSDYFLPVTENKRKEISQSINEK